MYQVEQPTREEVNTWTGPVVLEFGTDWCPICQGAQPAIERALAQHPEVRRVQIEDGPGRPLGRSFRVKLWPNLVFLKDGQVLEQLARPESAAIEAALRKLVAGEP